MVVFVVVERTDGTTSRLAVPADGKIRQEFLSGNNTVFRVTIPDGVVSIGVMAFYSCDYLESVALGNTLRKIEMGAFAFCSRLVSLHVPAGVTDIRHEAFYGCTGLLRVTFAGSGVKRIGARTFKNCASLASISLPDGLTRIGTGAFKNCSRLADVSLSGALTAIGEEAFSWCTSLASVVLPRGVRTIGSFAFSSCESLASLELPVGVESIGAGAFFDCESLLYLRLPARFRERLYTTVDDDDDDDEDEDNASLFGDSTLETHPGLLWVTLVFPDGHVEHIPTPRLDNLRRQLADVPRRRLALPSTEDFTGVLVQDARFKPELVSRQLRNFYANVVASLWRTVLPKEIIIMIVLHLFGRVFPGDFFSRRADVVDWPSLLALPPP